MATKINQSNVNKRSNKTISTPEKRKHTGSLPSGAKVEEKHGQHITLHKQKFNKVVDELKEKFENKSNPKPQISERKISNKEKPLTIEQKGQIFQKAFDIVTNPKNEFKDRADALGRLIEFKNDEDRSDKVDEDLNGILEDLRDAYETDKFSDEAKLYQLYQSSDDQTKLQTFKEAINIVSNPDNHVDDRSKALVRLIELKNEGEIDNKAFNGIIEDLRDAYESEILEGQKNENLSDDARLYNVYESFEAKTKQHEEYITHEREHLSKKGLSIKETPKNETVAIENQVEIVLDEVLSDKNLDKTEKDLAQSAKKLTSTFDHLSHSYKGMVEELQKIDTRKFMTSPSQKKTDSFNLLIKTLIDVKKDPLSFNVQSLNSCLSVIQTTFLSKTENLDPLITKAWSSLQEAVKDLSEFQKIQSKPSDLSSKIDRLKKQLLITQLKSVGLAVLSPLLAVLRLASMLLLIASFFAVIALAILFHPLVLIALPVVAILVARNMAKIMVAGYAARSDREPTGRLVNDTTKDSFHYRAARYAKEGKDNTSKKIVNLKQEIERLEKELKSADQEQPKLSLLIKALRNLPSDKILTLKAKPKEAEKFIKEVLK